MSKLAREGSHSYDVRAAATRIVHAVPGKQVRAELETLYRWVRDHVRYRFDPLGLEWVQAPTRTMLERAGDCDDMATLLAAFAGSLGHKWRFRTVGPSPGIMKHVAVEAWDGRGWVSLDPVLEPPASTTAPRADAGMFGRVAPARAHHTWSAEGDMLSGLAGPVSPQGVAMWEGRLGNARLVHVEPFGRARAIQRRLRRHRRRGGRPLSGLAGPVSDLQRELWYWAAYYPSDPQMRAGEGIAPTPSPVYRSIGAAGREPETIIVSAPAGTLEGGLGFIAGLGFGFLKKIGKAIGGVVKGAANLVTKIPGVNLIAKVIPGASLALDAAKAVGGMLAPGKKGAAPAAAAPAADGGNPYAPAASGVSGNGKAPQTIALAQRSDIDALRNEFRASAGFAKTSDLNALSAQIANRNAGDSAAKAAQAKKKAAATLKAAQKAAAKSAQAKEQSKAKKAIAKLATKSAKKIAALKIKVKAQTKLLKRARSSPCPQIGAKYPPGSRQTFDAQRGKYLVFAPRAGSVPGLGFFRPTLSFTLGAFGAFGLATAAQAASAIAAVAAFSKANKGQPPQVKLAAVAAFQKADGKLAADGVWGPNARVAAAWYLNQPPGKLPAVAAPYAKGKITWQPPAAKPPAAVKAAQASAPAAAAPKRVAKAAPKPVVHAAPGHRDPAPTPPRAVAVAKPKASKKAPKPKTKGQYIPPVPLLRQPQLSTPYGPSLSPVSVARAQAAPTAPAGMVPAGTEDANPGLPPVGAPVMAQLVPSAPTPAIPTSARRGRKGRAPYAVNAAGQRIVVDVSGPTIRRDTPSSSSSPNPLLLLGLGLWILNRKRAA